MNNQIEPMPKEVIALEHFYYISNLKMGKRKFMIWKKCLSLIIIKFKGNREIFKTVKTFGVNTCMENRWGYCTRKDILIVYQLVNTNLKLKGWNSTK